MVGIDAPESRENVKLQRDAKRTGEKPASIIKKGRKSTKRIKELVEGKSATIVFPYGSRKRDDYGRMLIYLEVNGEDIGERLIKEGLARPYDRFEHPRLERYRKTAETAHKAKKAKNKPAGKK